MSDRRGQDDQLSTGATNNKTTSERPARRSLGKNNDTEYNQGCFYPGVEDAVRSNGTDTNNHDEYDGTNHEYSGLLSFIDRFKKFCLFYNF